MPTYNPSDYIFEAIDSCLNQSYKSIKLTVVDDHSTIPIDPIIKKYPTVNFIRLEKNSGPAAARNFGIKNTSQKYISFLDDDDIMDKDKIAISIEELESNSSHKMICGNYKRIINGKLNNNFYANPIAVNYSNLLKVNLVASGSVTVRRDILNEIGLFNEDYRVCEDYDLWLRIAERYNIKYLHRTLYYYRVNTDGRSLTQSAQARETELANIKKIIESSKRRCGV
jgi:glycosyltransferase involved in cell wall biosynthesis